MKAIAAFATLLLMTMSGQAATAADAYPTKTIRILVGAATGGVADILVRALANGLRSKLNQTVIVENRPGANGALSAQTLANSPPDGYTLAAIAGSTLTISVHLDPKPSYNPLTDFQPISLLVANDLVLVQNNDFPTKTFAEFVAYVKANPGKGLYGFSGVGAQLGMALLTEVLGIQMSKVPYGGDSQVAVGVMSGSIPYAAVALPSVINQLKNGSMKPLAIFGTARSKELPDVPTITELGFPQNTVQAWIGLMAPKGLPEPILAKLASATREVMMSEDVSNLMTSLTSTVIADEPQAFKAIIAADYEKWRSVIARTDLSEKK